MNLTNLIEFEKEDIKKEFVVEIPCFVNLDGLCKARWADEKEFNKRSAYASASYVDQKDHELRLLIDFLKNGDRIWIEFNPGYHTTDPIRKLGFEIDVCRIIINRPIKPFAEDRNFQRCNPYSFIFDSMTCDWDSPVRMIQGLTKVEPCSQP